MKITSILLLLLLVCILPSCKTEVDKTKSNLNPKDTIGIKESLLSSARKGKPVVSKHPQFRKPVFDSFVIERTLDTVFECLIPNTLYDTGRTTSMIIRSSALNKEYLIVYPRHFGSHADKRSCKISSKANLTNPPIFNELSLYLQDISATIYPDHVKIGYLERLMYTYCNAVHSTRVSPPYPILVKNQKVLDSIIPLYKSKSLHRWYPWGDEAAFYDVPTSCMNDAITLIKSVLPYNSDKYTAVYYCPFGGDFVLFNINPRYEGFNIDSTVDFKTAQNPFRGITNFTMMVL